MDFSQLSDSQLLELLKAIFAEAINRGGAIAAAAQGESISAQERAKIEWQIAEEYRQKKEEEEKREIADSAKAKLEREEKAKESERINRLWKRKAAIVAAFEKWGAEEDFELNIWERGSDRRVYLQGIKRNSWKWCLYLSGNQWHPPGFLEGIGEVCWFDDYQERLEKILAKIAEIWKGDLRVNSQEIKKLKRLEPDSKHLAAYLEALEIS